MKPANLLVDDGLTVLLCDFGLSHVLPPDQDSVEGGNGTPGFVCPEGVLRQRHGGRYGDMWALGYDLHIRILNAVNLPNS